MATFAPAWAASAAFAPVAADPFDDAPRECARAENSRLGFFGDLAKTHQETPLQVAEPHQEAESAGWKTASAGIVGSNTDPASLHKYLYAHANPVSYLDPSGHFSLAELQMAVASASVLWTMAAPSVYAAAITAAPYIAAAGTSIALNNVRMLLFDSDYRNQALSTPGGVALTTLDIAGSVGGWYALGKALSTVASSYRTISKFLSKGQRLQIFYAELQAAPATDNARKALKQLSDTMDEVEDLYSGLPRDPMPPMTGTPRMYPPQADNVIVNADGSLIARSRSHITTFGADGSIVITEKVTGAVVFSKTGGAQ